MPCKICGGASGCARITPISCGMARVIARLRVIAAGPASRGRVAIRVTASTHRNCPKDTGQFTIRTAGGTDARAEGHKVVDGSCRAFQAALVHRQRWPFLAGAEFGESLEMGEVRAGRPRCRLGVRERGGSYTGRMLIDGEIYTPSEATKKFLQPKCGSG